MLGRRTTGESGDSEVESAPKEMYRAAFSNEPCAIFFENVIRLRQYACKCLCVMPIVDSVHVVALEWDRMLDLHGRRPNLGLDSQRFQRGHDLAIHLRNRNGSKRKLDPASTFLREREGLDHDRMRDEIKMYFK